MKAKINIIVNLENLDQHDRQASQLTDMLERVFRLSVPQKYNPKVRSSVEWSE